MTQGPHKPDAQSNARDAQRLHRTVIALPFALAAQVLVPEMFLSVAPRLGEQPCPTAFSPQPVPCRALAERPPEPKLFHAGLGRIRMTPAARAVLLALRPYLAGVVLLVGSRVLTGL